MAVWVWTRWGRKRRAIDPSCAKGARVVQRVDRLAEAGQVDRLGPLGLGQVGHRLLARRRPAVDEQGLVALRIEPAAAQEARLMRGPAEVQAGDHPQDPDSAQLGRSSGLGARAGVSSSAMTAAPTDQVGGRRRDHRVLVELEEGRSRARRAPPAPRRGSGRPSAPSRPCRAAGG